MGKLVLSPLAFFMKYYFFPPTLVLSLVATFTMELGRIGHSVLFLFLPPQICTNFLKFFSVFIFIMNVKTAILQGGRCCEKKHQEGGGDFE